MIAFMVVPSEEVVRVVYRGSIVLERQGCCGMRGTLGIVLPTLNIVMWQVVDTWQNALAR